MPQTADTNIPGPTTNEKIRAPRPVCGWIASLTGAAIAVLLILMDQQRLDTNQVWLSPEWAKKLYALSADTWTKATRELAAANLIDVERHPFRPSFDLVRVRNFYRLHLERLEVNEIASTQKLL
jgi:hypothetical protein